jgi:outer membrane protein assembly factor BamB
VFERAGRTWVVFGAYDYNIYFLDAETGENILPPFPTKDLAKGMVSVDPDGYPIIYQGSRDNKFRAIAIDGSKARELWHINARTSSERLWNDDWDAAALVLNGHLIQTSENSRLYVAQLNRSYKRDGSVTMNPRVVWSAPGWDQQLLRDLGDQRVSIESSPTVVGDVVYFVNSGGLLQGWDISSLRTGIGSPKRVLRFWTGDDTDATVVADADGYLYVGVEVDRNTPRAKAVGQFLKLDPRKPGSPLVWSRDANCGAGCGVWGTPALWRNTVIFTTKPGRVVGLDRGTGRLLFELRVGGLTLSSPVVVDDTLIQGDGAGVLRAWKLREGSPPSPTWQVRLGANIESTPAVWRGSLYVGARNGFFFKVSTRS